MAVINVIMLRDKTFSKKFTEDHCQPGKHCAILEFPAGWKIKKKQRLQFHNSWLGIILYRKTCWYEYGKTRRGRSSSTVTPAASPSSCRWTTRFGGRTTPSSWPTPSQSSCRAEPGPCNRKSIECTKTSTGYVFKLSNGKRFLISCHTLRLIHT